MKPPFRDRAHAGRELARMLEEFRGTPAIVLAIPAGGVPLDEARMAGHGLTPAQVERAIVEARAKVERRLALLPGAPLALDARSVILVDDGIAGGSTMR